MESQDKGNIAAGLNQNRTNKSARGCNNKNLIIITNSKSPTKAVETQQASANTKHVVEGTTSLCDTAVNRTLITEQVPINVSADIIFDQIPIDTKLKTNRLKTNNINQVQEPVAVSDVIEKLLQESKATEQSPTKVDDAQDIFDDAVINLLEQINTELVLELSNVHRQAAQTQQAKEAQPENSEMPLNTNDQSSSTVNEIKSCTTTSTSRRKRKHFEVEEEDFISLDTDVIAIAARKTSRTYHEHSNNDANNMATHQRHVNHSILDNSTNVMLQVPSPAVSKAPGEVYEHTHNGSNGEIYDVQDGVNVKKEQSRSRSQSIDSEDTNMSLESKDDVIEMLLGRLDKLEEENKNLHRETQRFCERMLDKLSPHPPVGHINEKLLIHLGQDVWIPKVEYENIIQKAKTRAQFVTKLTRYIFGEKILSICRLPRGDWTTRTIIEGNIRDEEPCLDIHKVLAICETYEYFLKTCGLTPTQIETELPKCRNYIGVAVGTVKSQSKKQGNPSSNTMILGIGNKPAKNK